MARQKTDPRAKLKTLRRDRQDQLWAMVNDRGPNGEPPMSYREAAKWVRVRWDVRTSTGALSEWYSWYSLRSRMERAQARAEQAAKEFVEVNPDATPEDIAKVGQMIFTSEAVEGGNFKQFFAMAQLLERQKGRELDSRRVKILESKAERADEARKALEEKVTAGGLSEETLELVERTLQML